LRGWCRGRQHCGLIPADVGRNCDFAALGDGGGALFVDSGGDVVLLKVEGEGGAGAKDGGVAEEAEEAGQF
jgi:hypothetical protein